MGLPTLCEVVREERDDLEMLRGALECLCLSVPASGEANSRRPQARAAVLNPRNSSICTRLRCCLSKSQHRCSFAMIR
jgi:hypothetical protein